MARSYHLTGDLTHAKQYYTEYTERFPNGANLSDVKDRLNSLN